MGDVKRFPLPRLDQADQLREALLPYCRLQRGEVWEDVVSGHRVGCLDATDSAEIARLMGPDHAALALHDPPYNLVAFGTEQVSDYIAWCRKWIDTTDRALSADSSLYVWLGADQNNHYQPLPDFMVAMRETPFQTRSFITMRNQRGYGTQKNWMAVRQELLYYTKGKPHFHVEAEYTAIPKVVKGYYKEVHGERTENSQRGRSPTIRAGNVWIDIQQVFYRLEENVNGCYAQKPLASSQRIIRASSSPGEIVIDFFCHSGTTLLASEQLGRKCYTIDIDPLYCEIAIRRLEQYRRSGVTGWQNSNPFEEELVPRMLGAEDEQP